MARLRLDVRTLRRTLRANRARLLALPNVQYLAIGRKRKGGRDLNRLAIIVYVTKKTHVPRQQTIPKTLQARGPDGVALPLRIPIDVEICGSPFKSLALHGGDLLRRHTRGSVGLAYRAQSGRTYILTNAHVVASVGQRAFGREVWRRREGKREVVGHVARICPVREDVTNKLDSALVTPILAVDRLRIDDLPLPVVGYGTLPPHERGQYFYVSNRRRIVCADPRPIESPVTIEYPGNVDVEFVDVIALDVLKGRPVPSHSGSLLFQQGRSGLRACGLLFAGSQDVILVSPIRRVFQGLAARQAAKNRTVEDVHIAFPT